MWSIKFVKRERNIGEFMTYFIPTVFIQRDWCCTRYEWAAVIRTYFRGHMPSSLSETKMKLLIFVFGKASKLCSATFKWFEACNIQHVLCSKTKSIWSVLFLRKCKAKRTPWSFTDISDISGDEAWHISPIFHWSSIWGSGTSTTFRGYDVSLGLPDVNIFHFTLWIRTHF